MEGSEQTNNEERVDLGNMEDVVDLDKMQKELEAMEEGSEKDALAEKIRAQTEIGESAGE